MIVFQLKHTSAIVSHYLLLLANTVIGSFPSLRGRKLLLGNAWNEISVGESWLTTCCDAFDLLIQSGTCCFRSSVLHPAEKRRNIKQQMAGGEVEGGKYYWRKTQHNSLCRVITYGKCLYAKSIIYLCSSTAVTAAAA